jgi:hypothetical protein
MVHSVHLENPDGLASLGGAVFVKTDDGRVARIDPGTGRVTRTARVDTAHDRAHYCQGIGSDGATLWACSAGDTTTDVVRLDPRTLAVTARVAVDKVFDQLALGVTGGRVWVLAGDGSRLTSVDTATGRQTTSVLPSRCFQLAATGTGVYVTCRLDDTVLLVDPVARTVVRRAAVTEPVNVSVSGGDVWVSGRDGLHRLRPDLGAVAVYPELGVGGEGDLAATPAGVWVRQAAGFLLRVDATTGRVTTRYGIDPVPSGGSLLVVGSSVWTSASDDATVFEVDARSG